MPKQVQITVPPGQTDALVRGLEQIDGIVGLRIQRGVSVRPAGDLLTLEVINRSMHRLMKLLDREGVGRRAGGSIVTSEIGSLISPGLAEQVAADSSEAGWEEMDWAIGRESSMTANSLAVMAISGAVATAGLATGSLHYIIAAMVIAPGFEPLTRVALGLVARSASWRQGIADTLKGYAALIGGAILAAALLRALGHAPLEAEANYLPSDVLVSYWTTPSAAGLVVTILASAAGALLIATHRSVLTAGVMIALSLIPAAALVGIGIAAGDLPLVGRSLLRWTVEAVCVLALSAGVFVWKRYRLHRRDAMP